MDALHLPELRAFLRYFDLPGRQPAIVYLTGLGLAVSGTYDRCVVDAALGAHRAVLVDFLEDSLRILHWYLDPKNHDAAVEIASQLTKQPPERFGWIFSKNDYYRDPNLMPDLDALQRNVDMTHELGFAKASFNVKTHSDLSLIQEAAKRLK